MQGMTLHTHHRLHPQKWKIIYQINTYISDKYLGRHTHKHSHVQLSDDLLIYA